MTSSSKTRDLRNEAIELRNRSEFARSQLAELASDDFEVWAKESFEIAKKIGYSDGAALGTPKGAAKVCSDVKDVVLLPAGNAQNARLIDDRKTKSQ